MMYLVTGADGFLGRHFLAELARRGAAVRAMVMPSISPGELPGRPEVVTADLLDPAALAKAVEGVSHVIHLAARVHMMDEAAGEAEQAYFDVNVQGTRLLLQAAQNADVKKFLLMSTVKAMGEQDTGTFDESTPPHPATPYGRSKLAAENVVMEAGRGGGMACTALRLPMVYGPGAKGNVLRLLEAAARGRRLPFGCIHNRRSMVYVGNVVLAALAAIDSSHADGQLYLVCDERAYSTAEVYSAICRAMGKPPLLRNIPVCVLRLAGRVGDLAEKAIGRPMPIDSAMVSRIAGDLCFSAERIRNEIGFSPGIALDEGMAMTVKWYLEQAGPRAC